MAVPICATKMRFMDCHYALLLSVTLLWLGRANELTLLSLCAASRKLGVETISEALATVMSSNVM